ncbi:hypothetical protein [Arthrobacter woluwensis]|uniref:hypothetical protein n=1 Tax=Arthrobacter woluwensis TaxID=156980 RepID=UPI0015E70EFE|nr:hypothetical protein [Arthrobacter woluwensis]
MSVEQPEVWETETSVTRVDAGLAVERRNPNAIAEPAMFEDFLLIMLHNFCGLER